MIIIDKQDIMCIKHKSEFYFLQKGMWWRIPYSNNLANVRIDARKLGFNGLSAQAKEVLRTYKAIIKFYESLS